MIGPRSALLSALICLFLGTLGLGSAAAQIEITNFDGISTTSDGGLEMSAGAHPDLTTNIEFSADVNSAGLLSEQVSDMRVELPPGLIGNANGIAKCSAAQFNQLACPDGTQVGIAKLGLVVGGVAQKPTFPIWNLEASPGVPAEFGISFAGVQIKLRARLQPGNDYRVAIDIRGASQTLNFYGSDVTFWGVPAASVHDAERGYIGSCRDGGSAPCPAHAPLRPFVSNPTACSGPYTMSLVANSWAVPAVFDRAGFRSHDAETPANEVGISGCDQVPFKPTFRAEPTSSAADSPTGLNVHVRLPQTIDPGGISTGTLRDAVVTLPQGLSVNPSSANGLGACAPAQIDLDGEGAAACPSDSKIGAVEIGTPLIDHPLKGGVYLAKQRENRFGSMLAIYLAVDDPQSGVVIKLPGRIATDLQSGRLTASFDDNPQLPFEDLHVEFFGGPQASLVTPATCGTYTTTARFAPWSGTPPVDSSDSFQIKSGPNGGPCPSGQFDPKLNAGTTNPIGGAYSPFALRLSREDGSQRLRSFSLDLPKGLVGKLAGIPYCAEAQLAAIPSAEGTGAAELATPVCPAASLVGTVSAGAGAGPSPFFVNTGRAYLAGPYKGAPLSLAIVTPAVAGPFDLGNVLVRTALNVDPTTAQLTAVSDPIPAILHGIPLNLRQISVDITRDRFTLNPTSCDPMSFSGTAYALSGAVAPLGDRFQVGSCERLGFKPKLALNLKGGTKRGKYPALRAVLTQPKGQANIGRVSVALPHSAFLAQEHIRTICTRVQFAAESCPKGSIYGYARATTPLLDKPLRGPVYLRSSNNQLPDLVAALDGQIEIDLVGRIDSKNGGIRTTFATVPDAPVSKFVLEMKGGKKGLLTNSTNLCKAANRATVLIDAHNGKTADQQPLVRAKCGKAKQRGKGDAK